MRSHWLFPILGFLSLSRFAIAAPPQSPFITQMIQSAEGKIKASPKTAGGYSDLAFALARRARETEDPAYWARAQSAIDTALQLTPGEFEARKARVIVRLQQGRYADAEEEARALNKQTPDDNLIYGLLADAALARGRYPEAEALTQRMLDLRQVNGPGLQRAARVREAIGFPDGASDFWNSAFRLASTSDTEERAYLLTQLAGLQRRRAKLAEASGYVSQALALQPDSPAALLEQARIALDSKKPDVALLSIRTRLEQQPNDIGALYLLTVALEAQGNAAESRAAGESYLVAARTADAPPPHDALLIRYLTAHGQAAEAVRYAKSHETAGGSQDFFDAYAIALLKSGDSAGAKEKMDRVLGPGIQQPQFFLDAAHIAIKNNDPDMARTYLKKCIEANSTSDYAERALEELQSTSRAIQR